MGGEPFFGPGQVFERKKKSSEKKVNFFLNLTTLNQNNNEQYDDTGRPFKFGFIGSAARCPSACAGQSKASPNANIEADAMASIIAHEVR